MPDGAKGSGSGHVDARRWLKREQPFRSAGRIALGFGVGILGALAFLVMQLPLPFFLGSLTFSLLAAVLRAPIVGPRAMSVPVRMVLGVAIGASFTPAILDNVAGMAGSLLLLPPIMVAITVVGTVYFERLARMDRPTAFFCAVPGGLTDMVSMASDAGANARAVTLVQATRIMMIVFLVPFWLHFAEGRRIGGAWPPGVRLAEFSIADAAALVGLGYIGWRLARRVGLAGAPLVGPMILSGIAHVAGVTTAKVPVEIMILAQVTLGVILGAQFRGVTWQEFSTTMAWGSLFSVVLVALTGLFAAVISPLIGFDSTSVLLAFAPGGQAELNLLAYVLGLDVAYTALHHLMRLAVVIFGAQIVFATNKGWRSDAG